MRPRPTFIVGATSRTGSNLLVRLLNRQPNVVCHGEIFQSNYDPKLGGHPEVDLTMRDRDPVAYWQELVEKYPRDGAAGCKIFYYHARSPAQRPIWDYLEAKADLKVIHLIRDNLLDVFLSRELATRSGVWHATSDVPAYDAEPVLVDVPQALAFFKNVEESRQAFDARFASHPSLTIRYAELSRRPADAVGAVCRLLGVAFQDDSKTLPTRKQRNKARAACIANYAEVAEAFTGGRYEAFLTEEAA